MMVEKVPDSTYEMVGGLDKQIKEIKEVIELPVKHPELFEALGIAQPKVRVYIYQMLYTFHKGGSLAMAFIFVASKRNEQFQKAITIFLFLKYDLRSLLMI